MEMLWEMKDTEVIAQYKMMRETLVYLTHLDYDDTEQIMLEKLNAQVDPEGSGAGTTEYPVLGYR